MFVLDNAKAAIAETVDGPFIPHCSEHRKSEITARADLTTREDMSLLFNSSHSGMQSQRTKFHISCFTGAHLIYDGQSHDLRTTPGLHLLVPSHCGSGVQP